MSEKRWPYEDIVDLPHHVSRVHPQMPAEKRAAQFAPFAALTGYDDAVAETARLTDDRIEMDEGALEALDWKIREAASGHYEIDITFFVPDDKKAGGSYQTVRGRIRRIERGEIELEDRRRILADRIAAAEPAG